MPVRAFEAKSTATVRGEAYATASAAAPERFRGEATLSTEARAGGDVKLVLAGYLRADTASWYDRSVRLDVLERREEAPLLSITELYVARRFSGGGGSLDLRLGKVVHAWGTADGFNPTDNLNARDYTDLLRADKLGAVCASLGYQLRDLGIDLVVLPVFQPSRLPTGDNRFGPELPSRVENPFFPTGPPELAVSYDFTPRKLPAVSWDHVQEALRVSYKLPGSAISASYGRYISDLPAIDVVPGVPDLSRGTVTVGIAERFERQEVLGADFQTAVGSIGLRGEAARVVFPDGGDRYGVAVFGLDHRWADLVGEQDLTVILSVLSQRGLDLDRPAGASLLSVETPFERGVLLHATWEKSEDVSFEVSAFTAFSKGAYQDATLTWRIRDPLKLIVKAERLAGPGDTYLGANQPNSRVWGELKLSF